MEVEITRLNDTGEGIALINGKTTFIPKTIIGDIVDVKIIKEYKNYNYATVIKYLNHNKDKRDIICPYFNKCGGCQLMGLNYKKQLEYKKEKIINIFKKYVKVNINPTIKESNEYYYRNKITLQVENGNIGLYEYNTNNLISIDKCYLVSNNINNLINTIKKLDLTNITKIIIREANSKLMINFIGQINISTLKEKLSSCISSIYLNDKLVFGSNTIIDSLGDYKFNVSPKSFFQVNHNQTINLYNQVKTYLGKNNNEVLDLYCGTGTIGIYVSENCKKITGIELNKSAVIDAIENVKLNNLTNVEIKQGDVGSLLDEKNTYDAIIVDPPRSGLDKKTRETLLKIKSPKLIYISCDPITLARDINDLKEIYEIIDITLFDMFPNTYHIECVIWMSLKK